MEWSDALSLGNDLLDDEDKEIIRLVNELVEYRDDYLGMDHHNFSHILSTLRKEVAQHFIDEELLMDQNKCPSPKLIEHTTDHLTMLLTLAETRYLTEEKILYQTLPYLSKKLASHMTTIDKECIPYLAKVRSVPRGKDLGTGWRSSQ